MSQIPEYICIGAGVLLLAYNRGISLMIIDSQRKYWGFDYGETAVNSSRVACVIVGIAAVMFGVMGFFFPGRQ